MIDQSAASDEHERSMAVADEPTIHPSSSVVEQPQRHSCFDDDVAKNGTVAFDFFKRADDEVSFTSGDDADGNRAEEIKKNIFVCNFRILIIIIYYGSHPDRIH